MAAFKPPCGGQKRRRSVSSTPSRSHSPERPVVGRYNLRNHGPVLAESSA